MGKNQSASNLPNIIQYNNGSINFVSGSTLLMQISSSGAITTTGVISGSNALSSSYSVNSDQLDGFDSTAFVFTSSYNSDSSSVSTRTTNLETASGSFSTRVTKIEGNYATTGSNVFLGAQTVCANITSTGTIIAQTLNVQQVTSSVVYSSGSNVFGNQLTDVQQFTGSFRVTGSGVHYIQGGCVGIGTTSPSATLDVNGIAYFRSSTGIYSDALTTYSGNNLFLQYGGSCNFILSGGTGGAERMRITSTGIACFACQVCAPTFVGSNANFNADFCYTSTGDISFTGKDANSKARFTGANASGQLGLFRSGSSQGGVYLGADSDLFRIYKSDFSSALMILNSTTGSACFAGIVCSPGFYSNCAIGINSYSSGIPLQIKRWVGSSGTVFLIGNDNVVGMPSITFCNDNGGGTAFVSMTANCQININGSVYVCPSAGKCYVGIGTSTPTNTLHILGANDNQIKIDVCAEGTYSSLNFARNNTTSMVIAYAHNLNEMQVPYTNCSCAYVAIYTGATKRIEIDKNGNLLPAANGTQNLGSSSCRWCTVYTSDLSLNNGIGNYTIVEGENDLFLYNNNSCKVYKFIVQEVCPEIAPAKRSI